MITISQVVADILRHDDIALAAARKGWLNLSSYARAIRPAIMRTVQKDVQEATVVTALSRLVTDMPAPPTLPVEIIQKLAIHPNLEGMTFERTAEVSASIHHIYSRAHDGQNSYLTVTQGINEITVVADARVAALFRRKLAGAPLIYDKTNLVGVTVKFTVGNLEVPNLIFALTRRLAHKNVNIVEVVSTATELTYIIERPNLPIALEQLQKDI